MLTRRRRQITDYLAADEASADISSEQIDITNDTIENNSVQASKRMRFTYPRILQGKYYEVLKDDNGKVEARCTNCSEIKKGHVTSTGNFLSHYRTVHATLLKELDEYRKGDSNPESKRLSLNQTKMTKFNGMVSKKKVNINYGFSAMHFINLRLCFISVHSLSCDVCIREQFGFQHYT